MRSFQVLFLQKIKQRQAQGDASYAVGALMGNQVKDLVDAQKEVINTIMRVILRWLKRCIRR